MSRWRHNPAGLAVTAAGGRFARDPAEYATATGVRLHVVAGGNDPAAVTGGESGQLAQRLAALDAPRAGTTPERASAVFSMMTSPASWRQLTHRAGWTFDEAEAWLTPSLTQLLLKQKR
jgi:hypothetical protein